MKSTTESLSPTRVKLTIEVPFEEFETDLRTAYRTISQQINVPGFRKGKVPAAVVDQRVGRSVVLDEAINAALPRWYSAALTEHAIQPLSAPETDLTKFADGEPIEVTAELDVRPDVPLPDLSTIEVKVDDVAVTDEDVDEQVDALRQRFATYTEVDRAAGDDDFVTIDLSAATQDGEAIEEAQAPGLPYTIGQGTMLDGLDEALTGMTKGESKTFATELVGGDRAGDEVNVTVVLHDVKNQELPELDDEFAQMASEFDTLQEMRADLIEKVTSAKRMEQVAKARDLVLDELVAQVDVALPEAFVADEISSRREQITKQLATAGRTLDQYLDDQEQTADEFDAELEKSVRDGLVAQFILDQIVENENLDIDDSELSQHIIGRAQQSGEDPSSFIQHIMEHNHVPEMVSEVKRGKALALLVEGAKVVDESGNPVDFTALRGDDTALRGDDTALRGDDTALRGNNTALRGDETN